MVEALHASAIKKHSCASGWRLRAAFQSDRNLPSAACVCVCVRASERRHSDLSRYTYPSSLCFVSLSFFLSLTVFVRPSPLVSQFSLKRHTHPGSQPKREVHACVCVCRLTTDSKAVKVIGGDTQGGSEGRSREADRSRHAHSNRLDAFLLNTTTCVAQQQQQTCIAAAAAAAEREDLHDVYVG